MRTLVRGFTLIEQLAVIAAVGVASATAVPSLLSVRDDAQAATLASLAGALSSAMVMNQGACLVAAQQAVEGGCTVLADCAQAGDLLQGGLPVGYAVTAAAMDRRGSACRLTHTASGLSASFTGVATGR